MRRKRTIYFNDARHYYLFVFEPPMTMEDAWRPIDECAGTGVDTFVYGVSRDDGLFYPSRVGQRFKHGEHGTDSAGFRQGAYWRLWNNMQSLIDRGLDPLGVLIDRAHEKGMDFIASLRLGGYGGMDPAHAIANGGRNFVHEEVRSYHLAVLGELATEYATQGVELDFAAVGSGSAALLREDDVAEHTAMLTEWVAEVSAMARSRQGEPCQVGARVFPTEEMNLARGFDVSTLLREGYLDYVTPMIYAYNLVDANMPIDWLIAVAHESEASVFPMVQGFYHLEGSRRFHDREHATPAMMRAATANFWDKGADGMYTQFLRWPLRDIERAEWPGFRVAGADTGDGSSPGVLEGFRECIYAGAVGELRCAGVRGGGQAASPPVRISWEATVPENTSLRLQLRSAETEEALASVAWMGPQGEGSWYQESGSEVALQAAQWIQYRATLVYTNGCRSPQLTEVRVELAE